MAPLGPGLNIAELVALGREILQTAAAALSLLVAWRQARRERKI